MGNDTIDIKNMTPEELHDLTVSLEQPPYRSKQMFKWLIHGARSIMEMTDVPISFRRQYEKTLTITSLETVDIKISSDGTRKYLFKLEDGNIIESVYMKYIHGNSVCVSSQVGCKYKCAFCASAKNGFIRNLTPGEMLDQIVRIQRDLCENINGFVIMGIGEPLDNYDNVLKFIRLANHPESFNIGMRHISLSTCGLVDKIDFLKKENLQLTLSVSLHAAFDEKRSEIMPVNKKYPLASLIDACRRYAEATGRRISFEYIMAEGFNDGEEDAAKLAELLRSMLCHVNLIILNEIPESKLKGAAKEKVYAFQSILTKAGVQTTVRRRLGLDIKAACGQLRRDHIWRESDAAQMDQDVADDAGEIIGVNFGDSDVGDIP